jgi:hypothetical protein
MQAVKRFEDELMAAQREFYNDPWAAEQHFEISPDGKLDWLNPKP